ncbi:amidohydrolase [Bacillus sp. AFS055030]|uniref:amidohydrolase n=1 Tax=Bacillus sp. AFS055030 TaxID=2033507 RepID=UPI000BFB13F8|nr:amidohydrolase [Bacillus sp. AFS055030]PGL69128.1 amidohydrolase [Bacillus sp. AFS055030]
MKKLWHNGLFYTMEGEGETVDAIITEDEKIIKTGTFEVLLSFLDGEQFEKMNCNGKIGFPGFIDSHLHLIGHGEAMNRVDLSKCQSYDEMIERMKRAVKDAHPNEWIVGEGWNENEWESKAEFCIDDLNRLSSTNPFVLKRTCRHVYFVNAIALNHAQINEHTQIEGGQIGCFEDGCLNGLLYDEAVNLIIKAMPAPDDQYLSKAIISAIKDCYQYGIVGAVTEDLSYYGNANLVIDLYEQLLNEVPFHTHVLIHHTTLDEVKGRVHKGNKNVSFGGVKAFIDGSFGGRTALLEKPYDDDQSTTGLQVTSLEKLEVITKKARENKLPIAFHMIGDLAVKQAIEVVKKYPNQTQLPDRFIHCSLLSPKLIEEMKELNIVVDVQTSFIYADYPWLVDRIGHSRNEYAFLIKSLLNESIAIANGSDTPIDTINPWQGIYTAVTRKAKDHRAYNIEEAISLYEAIKLYTIDSAASFHQEDKRGLIKEGYFADFILFDENPFEIEKDELLHVKCSETICRGNIVYKRQG